MQNQDFRSSNSKYNEWIKKKTKEQFSNFRVLVEESYKGCIHYIEKNPAKVFWGGTATIAFSFMFGYISGSNIVTDNMVRSINSNMSTIDRQNLNILNKLEELTTTQYNLSQQINSLYQQSKSRLNTLENRVQFNEAVKQGEENVKKIEKQKKKGLKKLLPWNWF